MLFFITGFSLEETPNLIIKVDVKHKDILVGHLLAPRTSSEKWSGQVTDFFGQSEIFDFEMDDLHLSFVKLNEKSSRKVYYYFVKMLKENWKTFWVGGWHGENNDYGFAEIELLRPSQNFACGRQDLKQLTHSKLTL